MILRDIYLYPDLREFPALSSDVRFETRSICHFLAREVLKRLKHRAEFRRLCLIGKEHPSETPVVNSSKAACVDFPFDSSKWQSLEGDQTRAEFYAQQLEIGLKRAEGKLDLPFDELGAGIERFRASAYENTWIHKKRRMDRGIFATLRCRLTMSQFQLSLSVERESSTLWSETILETKPDELLFAHRFRDLSIEDNSLVVTSQTTDPLFSLSLETLEK